MTPGTSLQLNGSVGFGPDRFGNPFGAIYLNNGYYQVPAGVYFSNGGFSILAWIKLNSLTHGARLIDFGISSSTCSVVVQLVNAMSPQPCFYITSPSSQLSSTTTGYSLSLNVWYHIGAVLNGTDLYLYINGVLKGSHAGLIALPNYKRQNCYFGRSSYYGNGDFDADAYFDEIKFYGRALNQYEVENDLNISY